MPNEQKVTRKLRAILSADAKGYSVLMANDEAATVHTINSYREVMTDLIQRHNGRVVDAKGDNVLAGFPSVVDAVQCAVDIQKQLALRNADLPEDRKMEFRIGVNLGDVIEEEETLYGDGVNVAARLEGLAGPGGVSISGTAFDQVRDKLDLGYKYLGEVSVKNIPRPIRAYNVLMEPEHAGKLIGEKRSIPGRWRLAAIAGVLALILFAGSFAIWSLYFRHPAIEPASIEKMVLPLPDRPSLAVLPFDNMSGDPAQEYVSDGITESIITAVSKIRHLFVIARNSTFTYKGKAVKIQQVAQELGVQYVLEGSVQRSGDRLRVTAQLIDALNGRHIWAEQYDRDLQDLFDMQDEITMEILEAMRIKLIEGEQVLKAKRPQSVQSALKIYQAQEYTHRFTPEAMAMAKKIAEEVVAIEPDYGEANYILSTIHMMEMWYGIGESPEDSLAKATAFAEKAISLDESLSQAMGILGYLYGVRRQWDKSVAVAEKGVSIDPNGADAHAWLGNCLNFAYRYQDAIPFFEKAIRLNPFPPPWYYFTFAISYINLERYEEAIALLEKSLSISPNNLSSYLTIIRPYLNTGREEEARAAAEKVLQINPNFSVEDWVNKMPHKEPGYAKKVSEALLRAGLPYTPPLPLPDKPSIAILAFDNLSGDPEQEYFSDGISENIITALSKVGELFVIARNSSFIYKDKPVKVQHIGRELGVRYVLEGSVQKSGERVRITAQLIDAKNGQHLWAENYDRDFKDIFDIQDEMTMKIVTALRIELTEGEQARIFEKQSKNINVFLKFAQALSLMHDGTKEGLIRFGQLGQEIVDIDPDSSTGYRMLGWYHWTLAMRGKSPQESTKKSFRFAQKALSRDESDPLSHALLGNIYLIMRKHEKADESGKRAVELAPNGAIAHATLGNILSYTEHLDKAVAHLKQAIRLNPFPPFWYYYNLGRCYRQKGQYEDALTEFKKGLQRSPDAYVNYLNLAITYVLLERQEEAEAAAKKVIELFPNFTIGRMSTAMPYKNPADLKSIVAAMRKAGLPE